MSAIRGRLLQFESHLQTLVEGSVARFFPEQYSPHDLAWRLAEAMRTEIRIGANGDLLAPNLFVFSVHEQHALALQAEMTSLEDLAQILYAAGLAEGFQFVRPPIIRLAISADIALGDIQVTAQHSFENLPDTAGIETSRPDALSAGPQNAFLIVDGTRIFPLSEPVINVGRREDNDLVIDDPRVSRLHAQLRIVRDCYVIFDLDSMGGTWVNGARIQHHPLQPGDVISLSGLPIVYGQDLARPDETQEYSLGL